MAGPEGIKSYQTSGKGVVTLRPDAVERSEPLIETLGKNPTAERLAAVLGEPGTGVTGATKTIPAPGETGTDITALGTQDGIPSVDGDGDGEVEIEIEE